jgi:hypothetical protein
MASAAPFSVEDAVAVSLDAISARVVAACAPLDGSVLTNVERLTDVLFAALFEKHRLWEARLSSAVSAGAAIELAFTIDAAPIDALGAAADSYRDAYDALVLLCGDRLVASDVVRRYVEGAPLPAAPAAKATRAATSAAARPLTFQRALENWVRTHALGVDGGAIAYNSCEFSEVVFRGHCIQKMYASFEDFYRAKDGDTAEEAAHKAKAHRALDAETSTLEDFTIVASEFPLTRDDFADVRATFNALSDAFQAVLRETCTAFGAHVLAQLRPPAKERASKRQKA